MIINDNGGHSLLAAYVGGPVDQAQNDLILAIPFKHLKTFLFNRTVVSMPSD